MPHLEEQLLRVVLAVYVFGVVSYLLRFVTRSAWTGRLATGLATLGLCAHTAMLVARGISAGHVPLVSMYEYLAAFSWMVVAAYLIFEWRAGTAEGTQAAGGPALILALLLLGYAATLPANLRQAEDLLPVLRSNWLIFHVSCAVVGYGAAGLASALACLYFVHRVLRGDRLFVRVAVGSAVLAAAVVLLLNDLSVVPTGISYLVLGVLAVLAGVVLQQREQLPGKLRKWLGERLPSEAALDRSTHRAVRFAFPFLTLVNVTGAVWAFNAWGRYWGWDPKETATLSTWFIYAGYLHTRSTRGWRGRPSAVLLVIGFLAVLFTFFGSLFFGGLHGFAV